MYKNLAYWICLPTVLFAYQWPIADFGTQHIVTGGYGEVRSKQVAGQWEYRHHVHDAIDIDKGESSVAVYPVVSGTIFGEVLAGEEIIYIEGNDGYYYTYHHLENTESWDNGAEVIAGETILGHINTGDSNHLHFVDGILNESTYNPILYIYPFADSEDPVIEYIKVVSNLGDDDTPVELSSIDYNQKVDIIVKAHEVISSPGGNNNSVYYIYTTIFDPGGSQVAIFPWLTFASGGNNGPWDVKKIYAKGSQAGSGLSGIYIYISTNNLSSDNYWWNTVDDEGYYTIQVNVRDEMFNEIVQTKTIWVEGSANIEENKH